MRARYEKNLIQLSNRYNRLTYQKREVISYIIRGCSKVNFSSKQGGRTNWKYAKDRQSLNLSTKKAARVLVVPVQLRRLINLFSSSIVLRNSH